MERFRQYNDSSRTDSVWISRNVRRSRLMPNTPHLRSLPEPSRAISPCNLERDSFSAFQTVDTDERRRYRRTSLVPFSLISRAYPQNAPLSPPRPSPISPSHVLFRLPPPLPHEDFLPPSSLSEPVKEAIAKLLKERPIIVIQSICDSMPFAKLLIGYPLSKDPDEEQVVVVMA